MATSFAIHLSGTGQDPDDTQEIFETTVRALRTIVEDQTTMKVEGYLNATGDSNSISLTAEDVADIDDPADPGEDEPEV